MFEVLRFFLWAIGLLFAVDFVYSAFHQGRHLNRAFQRGPGKRGR